MSEQRLRKLLFRKDETPIPERIRPERLSAAPLTYSDGQYRAAWDEMGVTTYDATEAFAILQKAFLKNNATIIPTPPNIEIRIEQGIVYSI